MENKERYDKSVIIGAGGRDFFNFLCHHKYYHFRKVVAFVVTQIPGIDNRRTEEG